MHRISRDSLESLASKINNKQKLLLTGGTGFFGKSIIKFLINLSKTHNANLDLTILSRSASKFYENHKLYKYDWIDALDDDINDIKSNLGKYTHILHAATPSHNIENITPKQRYDFIINSTEQLLNQLKSSQSILFVSSGDVYKSFNAVNSEQSSLNNSKDIDSFSYCLGKIKSETILANYCSSLNISFKIARCFAFVGEFLPLDAHFAIGNFIGNCIKNEDIIINGDGKSIRSYMYQDDLAYWLIYLLLTQVKETVYNVGSSEGISIIDLAKKIKYLTQSNCEIKIKNVKQVGNRNYYVPDIAKASEDLNLIAWTSLDDAIVETFNFHEKIKKYSF